VSPDSKIAILCDFDGTVAERDVGHKFFEAFIPDRRLWLETLEQWKMGMISSRKCLENEISWIEAGKRDIDGFVEKENLDPYFRDFVDFCVRRKYDLLILSDGLDYYIDTLLMKSGVGFIPFKANHLRFDGEEITGIDFPHFDTMECTMCGNCKRHHLEEKQKNGFFTVYVGNGYSDRCPAVHADLVLAKGDLLDHCTRENVACIPFCNFRDVERELTNRFVISP
jgi:2-hydroxy-3-keto-5-methylthiopentenyl-1-phosphate phosphatase